MSKLVPEPRVFERSDFGRLPAVIGDGFVSETHWMIKTFGATYKELSPGLELMGVASRKANVTWEDYVLYKGSNGRFTAIQTAYIKICERLGVPVETLYGASPGNALINDEDPAKADLIIMPHSLCVDSDEVEVLPMEDGL